MERRIRQQVWLAFVVTAISGCGNTGGDATTGNDSATLTDDSGGPLEIVGGDVLNIPDTAAVSDTGAGSLDGGTVGPSGDGSNGDNGGSDNGSVTTWPNDLGSGLPFDVAQPDVPYVDLTVLSTTPKSDASATKLLPNFSIKFSAKVDPQSIADYTVVVTNAAGQTIAGALTLTDETLLFKADSAMPPVSRIDVRVTALVRDVKGQTLAAPYVFHFFTNTFEKMQAYNALAARYAPEIRQGLNTTAPVNDLLRAMNYDGDWLASNNQINMSKFDATAIVSWAVAETQSHFFIHYVFSWPRRTKSATQSGYDNDTAGATVIVRRYPSELPVALETWFKRGQDERKWLWVTSESGFVPTGKSPGAVNVRAVLPLKTLFPISANSLGCAKIQGCTARRFAGYLTGGSHQSCLWSDLGEKVAGVCATDAFNKNAMALIRYIPGLKATMATPTGVKPGATLPTFTYQLEPLFDTWFARRTSTDLFVKPMTFVYKSTAGRPTGQKLAMGSKLLGGGADFGRPPWAWRWKPANNTSYYDLPRGTVFFDPAYALWQRIGGKTAGLKGFDAKTKTGISLAYCFAPFLFIDQRTIASCKNSLPSP